MLMFMKFSQQKRLCFLDGDIHGNPSFVLVVHDARIVNAEVSEPFSYVGNCLFFWGKGIVNLLGSPMLAILVRGRVRPVRMLVSLERSRN